MLVWMALRKKAKASRDESVQEISDKLTDVNKDLNHKRSENA